MKDSCPACKKDTPEAVSKYDTWLQCDACPEWYHAHCLGFKQVEFIDRFHCPPCIKTHGPITFKPEQRKTNRRHERLNYANLNDGTAAGDERIWRKLLQVKQFTKDTFQRYKAKDVNLDLIRRTGMREPFVIEEPEPELDMKMPPVDITVHQIAELVGKETLVDVIDVVSQAETVGWTMARWADYFDNTERDRIRNVISLEISESKLAEQIQRPGIVRDMDWINLMWPDSEPEYPKVQLYCLMGTKDSYTDFHIDFGGSSVFYHILRGSKTFYFIEPTDRNLKKYQKWGSSSEQSVTFLGDLVKDCYRVDLKAGNTLIIPTGWIHAVFTPEDSLVIGGNFLHSFNVATQLKVYKVEVATEVPLKFRFPYYKKLNWYAIEKFDTYFQDKKMESQISIFEVESMIVLARFLYDEITDEKSNHTISSSTRKLHQIPDCIQDPIVLLHRVKKAAKHILRARETAEQEKATKNVIRVVLKVKNEAPSPKKIEDDYEFDEEEEEDEDDWKIDEDIEAEDDDEYKEDANVHTEPNIIPAPSRERSNKPRSRKRTLSNRSSKKSENSSSDDEDSMGTSKSKSTRLSTSFSRKRSLSNNSNPSQPSTAKQRILGMINGKKY